MRTIIFGSRGCTDYRDLLRAVRRCGFEITSVVSGCARGADMLGERFAAEQGIPIHRMPAAWDENVPPGRSYNPRAGFDRNVDMAEFAARAPEGGAALGLWDGKSRGTRHMEGVAREHRLRVHVERVEPAPMPKTGKIKLGRRKNVRG